MMVSMATIYSTGVFPYILLSLSRPHKLLLMVELLYFSVGVTSFSATHIYLILRTLHKKLKIQPPTLSTSGIASTI